MNPLWRAVYALREADALTGMSVQGAGPTDAPPERAADEESWTKEWLERAKRALAAAAAFNRKALEAATLPELREALRERAVRIARRVSEGAKAARSGLRNVARETIRQLDKLHEDARDAAGAWASTVGMGALLIAALAAVILLK